MLISLVLLSFKFTYATQVTHAISDDRATSVDRVTQVGHVTGVSHDWGSKMTLCEHVYTSQHCVKQMLELFRVAELIL